MIDISILVLVLGSIALVGAVISLNAWLGGRVHTKAMAQLEEGYRQAICGADEIGNKLMAMLDSRAHAYYRQAAGVQGKPPAVRSHDAPGSPFPQPRIARSGSSAPIDPESIAEAQRKTEELEELARRNGVQNISSPSDYGAREPE